MEDIWIGTSYHGDVIHVTYDELVNKIGEPMFDGSGDDKVQKEWRFVTDDNVPFTVYDWKEYERDVTDGDIVEWHIGYDGENAKTNIDSIKRWFKNHDIVVKESRFVLWKKCF